MSDHLEEIKALAAQCIEETIELLPGYTDAEPEEETRKKVSDLLINLRAIQHEAKMLETEGRHS